MSVVRWDWPGPPTWFTGKCCRRQTSNPSQWSWCAHKCAILPRQAGAVHVDVGRGCPMKPDIERIPRELRIAATRDGSPQREPSPLPPQRERGPVKCPLPETESQPIVLMQERCVFAIL